LAGQRSQVKTWHLEKEEEEEKRREAGRFQKAV